MTRYNKIYIPSKNNDSKYSLATEYGMSIVSKLDEHSNVIVLTVEELRELWNAAQDRANALQLGDPGDTKIFEAYMKSKGINIEG